MRNLIQGSDILATINEMHPERVEEIRVLKADRRAYGPRWRTPWARIQQYVPAHPLTRSEYEEAARVAQVPAHTDEQIRFMDQQDFWGKYPEFDPDGRCIICDQLAHWRYRQLKTEDAERATPVESVPQTQAVTAVTPEKICACCKGRFPARIMMSGSIGEYCPDCYDQAEDES